MVKMGGLSLKQKPIKLVVTLFLTLIVIASITFPLKYRHRTMATTINRMLGTTRGSIGPGTLVFQLTYTTLTRRFPSYELKVGQEATVFAPQLKIPTY